MKDVPIPIGGGWQGDYAPNEMPPGGLQTCLNVIPEAIRYLPVLRPSTILYTTTSYNPVLTREFPATSIDSLVFTSRPNFNSSVGVGDIVQKLIYGNGLFVLGAGNNIIWTSADTVTWTERQGLGSGGTSALAYGNGIFVAGAANGQIYRSSDAITWTLSQDIGSFVDALSYGNGKYVAGLANGEIYNSTDAITWELKQTLGAAVICLAYGNGIHIAGLANGEIYNSTDTVTWTLSQDLGAVEINAVAYGNGVYVAGDSAGKIWSSTDAAAWTERQDMGAVEILALAYGNGLYLASDSAKKMWSSADATTWTQRQSFVETDAAGLASIAYGNGFFVTGDSGNNFLWAASANLIRTENRNFLIDVNGCYYVDYRSNKYTLYSFTYQLDSSTPTPQLEPYKNGIVLRKKGETPQIIRNIFDIVPGVVSITRASSVATVTVSGAITSQWAVGDKVIIAGCAETEYNGTQTITTIPTTSTFTYTVSGTPSTPATTATVITAQFMMSPVGGTPPTATYGTFNNGFHLLFQGKTATWSEQDDIDNYVADDFPGPGSQVFSDAKGDVVGAETIGNRTIVFHQNSITIGDYTGIPDAFTWQQNFSNIGATPSSIVKVNDRVYFYNENDFYVTDGNTVEPLQCKCFNSIFSAVNKSGLRNIPISVPSGTSPGFQNDFVIWSFTPSTWFANQTTFLILNIQTGIFAKIVFSDTNIYSLGLTHNEAGTQLYLAAAVWTTAEFGSTAALSLKYLDGTSLAIQLLTGGLTDEEGHMVMRCNGIIPKLYNMTAANVTGKLYAYWQEHSTTNTASTANALNNNGVICQSNVGGKMLTCQLDIAAGETGRIGHTLGLRIGGGGKK